MQTSTQAHLYELTNISHYNRVRFRVRQYGYGMGRVLPLGLSLGSDCRVRVGWF